MNELVCDSQNRGVDLATSNICFSFGEAGEYKDVRTVIDEYGLVERLFTVKYLFVVNKIR